MIALKTLCMAAAAASVFAIAGSAHAAVSLTTATGDGADVELRNDAQDSSTGPDDNRGARTRMTLRINAGSRIAIPYFRFDISDVEGDLSGGSIALDLAFNNGSRSRDVQLYGVVDGANDLFGEGTINYANAGGFTYTDPDPSTEALEPTSNVTLDNSEVTFLGNFQVSGTGLQTTLTPTTIAGQTPVDLTAFLNSDTNDLVTFFLLRGNDANVVYEFATKEDLARQAPTLNLPNASLVPEPATLGALSLAGVALLTRRRKA